jgi:Rrf2 family protein
MEMLNQTTEHAVRALLYLAGLPFGEAASAERLARALGAPANYLGKTLNVLARGGLLRGTRGPQGGFRLTRRPGEITLAEVAAFFAEPRPRTLCLLGDRPCSELEPCRAHRHWTTLQEQSRQPLRRTTIADLLDPSAATAHPASFALPAAG